MTVYVGCDIEGTNGCCGVSQIVDFSNNDLTQEMANWRMFQASGKDAEEAYKNLFDIIQNLDYSDTDDDYSCSVLQIWFVKYRDFNGNDNPEYEAAPLMRLVEGITNVVSLGEHRNVNSGNLIKGYQWSVA